VVTGALSWACSRVLLAQLPAPITVSSTVSAARHPPIIDAPSRASDHVTLARAHWFRGTRIGGVASEHREGRPRCATGSAGAADRVRLGGTESRRDS